MHLFLPFSNEAHFFLFYLFVPTSVTFDLEGAGETVEVFTTRADTLMGVTYLVLAPEHPLTLKLATDERRAVSSLAFLVFSCARGCGYGHRIVQENKHSTTVLVLGLLRHQGGCGCERGCGGVV